MTVVARTVAALLLVALFAVGFGAGYRTLQGVLYRNNPKFSLRTLEITTGSTVTAEDVRQVTGIREGSNLFLFNLPRLRHSFLLNLPNVRDIRMERKLPDTLRIAVFERIPMSRLSRSGRVVTDFDGYIFSVQPGQDSFADMLPILASEEWANLQPGQRLGPKPRAGLAVLDTADAMHLSFRIAEVDTTNAHYLILHTTDRQEIRLPWDRVMNRRTVTYMLGKVSDVIASPSSASKNRFDVNPDDGRVIAGLQ